MLELACRECDFHFNKRHLEDPTIPMWVLRAKGKSYYVNHVTANIPWSTKESPDNPHTKGAIKFKDVHLKIDSNNCAELYSLTSQVAARLRAKERGYTRILITWKDKVVDFLQSHGIRFTPFKHISGGCGSNFYVCDIINPNDVVMMRIGLEPHTFRILNENETYYMAYDDPALLERLDADSYDDLYEE
jgi:hypothetical protein